MSVHRGDPIALPEGDVFSVVFRDVDKHRHQVALVDPVGGREMTFGEYHDETLRLAAGLHGLGVGQGSVVAIVSTNSLEYAVLVMASMRLGAVVTLANPSYTPDELAHQLRSSGAEYVVTQTELLPTVRKASTNLPRVKNTVTFGDNKDGLPTFSQLLQASPRHLPTVRVNQAEDLAFIPYSSGTTGLPKGVMLTHRNSIFLITISGKLELQDDVSLLCFVPMFHIYGLALIIFCAAAGKRLVVLSRFVPEHFLQAVVKYKIQNLSLVPPIVVLLTKTNVTDGYDLSHLRYAISAAAPLGYDLEMEFRKKFNIESSQGWGMTELSGLGTYPIRGGKTGSVGKVLFGTEIKVVDTETLETLGPHQEGEIWCRGPHVMKGYINNPEATRSTIVPGGWLRTGDIGKYDEDGYFFITDRLKELIKYKAFQVAPAELENLLLQHPAVGDAAVVGVPDLVSGELPRAYVVLKPGAKPSAEDIQRFVEERAAKHKWLRGGVEFTEAIPKSASGKILRRELRRLVAKAKL